MNIGDWLGVIILVAVVVAFLVQKPNTKYKVKQ